MSNRLTAAQIEHYHRDGFVSPVRVSDAATGLGFRRELEQFEAQLGHPLEYPEKSKSYLLCRWADAIVHHQAVLDAVEDLIGPDILVYHTTMWTKEARQPAFVLWHQDGTYFFLEPAEQVTAWVALTDATAEMGCVRIIPGSHRLGQLPHTDDPSPLNMIKRGQGIHGRFDHETGVALPLRAGEMSLHHTYAVHSSGPNHADDRRMGLGISYIPTHVRPIGEPRPSALLVRGVDRYRHFEPEQRLVEELSPQAWAAHDAANRRFRARQDAGSPKPLYASNPAS
jgi:ectoine hydroxylase-related dioxygenase (phytanoyl-CoA dioxygenase family)